MRTIREIRSIVLALALCAAAASGQSNGGGDSVYSRAEIPFSGGEVLTYEGKLSKIIRGLSVAELKLSVTDVPHSNDYLLTAEAKSKGTLLKLFRFSFLQLVASTVDGQSFRALKTTKHDVQKDRVRDSEAIFDYGQKRVTYIETDPKEPMRPPRKIASMIKDHTHDIISGIYALRMLPLAVGKSFDFWVSDSGLVYRIPVKVAARERLKTSIGTVWCYRLEPNVFGPDRFIEQEGSMLIWITDDKKRIPVRAQINSSLGRVEVKLKSVKGRK
ncbi:MAG: DUF3108 domain-containing protein [Pyrinomonadaceae bacterium]